MAEITALKALMNYFNRDADGKAIKPLREFNAELKELADDEKAELAGLAAEAMGDTVKA